MLNQIDRRWDAEDTNRFEVAEIRVADDSKLSGRTLAELRFRQEYGVTLVGIRRGKDQVATINPAERILAGDCLIVIGTAAAVRNLKSKESL